MNSLTSPPRSTQPWSATRRTVAALGVLAGLTGIEHGIGEVTQGRGAPSALVFESWPHVRAFDPLNGEPAMSIVPDLLFSGLLSVMVAAFLGICSVGYAHRRNGGWALIGLSLLLLLVGGGFGPPVVGLVAGALATRVDSPPAIRGATRFVARLWPWPLVVAIGCFLGLVPGVPLLYATLGLDNPLLVALLTVAAFVSLWLSWWSARAHDALATRSTSASGQA